MATGAATAQLSLTVRLTVAGQPAQGDLPVAAALSAVAGSARRLLALAGVLSPGADVGVLSRAMEELDRLAAGGGTAVDDRVDPSTSTSTSTSTAADDMDIDSGDPNQLGGSGAGAARGRDPGAKRKREARRDDAAGMSQRPAKRRILAWRARLYRSLVAKAKATARRARSRRAQPTGRRRKAGSWESVQQQLARASLSDGLHRWSPGGGGGGPAEQ